VKYLAWWCVCSGIVAEKTDSELFFVDKNAVTSDTSQGECDDCWSEVFSVFLSFIAAVLHGSVVTVIEIGTETAVFQQNRTETKVLCLSVDGFANGAALALPETSRQTCFSRVYHAGLVSRSTNRSRLHSKAVSLYRWIACNGGSSEDQEEQENVRKICSRCRWCETCGRACSKH